MRIWAIYSLGLGRFGNVDVGGILRANSGLAYSIRSTGISANATQRALLTDLGYADRPSSRTIYYSQGRGSEAFPGYALFDLSLNYDIPIWQALSPWIKAEIYNLFNNAKLISFNTTVRPNTSGPVDGLGIPTTYTEGTSFGDATSADDYPQYLPGLDGLRAFQLAFGVRW